jgi:8-oxo-dGTP pyrophosphatase MutT (NUDIX family)
MKKVISAGLIVIRRSNEGIRYLVLYHGGSYWNFPKGKMESEERSWQTAIREVNEETGLKNSELKLFRNFKTKEEFTFRAGKEKIFKIVILYLAETKQSHIKVSREHEGYGWFTYKEAKRILSKHKDSVRILEDAHAFLHGKSVPSRGTDPARKSPDVQGSRAPRREPARTPRRRQHSEQKPAPSA